MNSIIWGVMFGLAGLSQDGKSPQEEALQRLAAEPSEAPQGGRCRRQRHAQLAEFRVFMPAFQKAADALLNEIDPTIAKKKAAKSLKKYDVSADGKLDEAEKKAMDEALAKKAIKEFDWDGDGKLDEKEKQAQQWAAEGRQAGAFRKADADGNGQLTADEITAALPRSTGIKVKKAK
jgi:hypothetical protein